MTQVSNFSVARTSGSGLRQGFNAIVAALRDGNAGPTAPPNPVPHMIWIDNSGGTDVPKIRNRANTAWQLWSELIGAAVQEPRVHTTSGTLAWPSGTKLARVRLVGGGGGGGGVDGDSTGAAASAGGGAGGYVEHWIVNPVGSYTVAIGAGGAGGAGLSGGNGGGGGTSTFVSGAVSLTAGGGAGGDGMIANIASTARRTAAMGGAASGGNMLNIDGQASTTAAVINGVPLFSGNGGSSLLGSGGGGAWVDAGNSARGFGAGGGGTAVNNTSSTNFSGGSGRPGVCIVELFE